jgi:hypothetical protein
VSGDVLRRAFTVRMPWGDASHFAAGQSLPCRICSTVTQMRDDQGLPCHLECAERELAAAIAVERWPGCSERELTQELFGHTSTVPEQFLGRTGTPEVRS